MLGEPTPASLEAVATAAAEAVLLQQQSADAAAVLAAPPPPPPPLPPGWHLKESRSNPGYCYYFDQETGTCSWYPPAPEGYDFAADEVSPDDPFGAKPDSAAKLAAAPAPDANGIALDDPDSGTAGEGSALSVPGHGSLPGHGNHPRDEDGEGGALVPAAKRPKTGTSGASAPTPPSKVRILHILKKHVGSRRPSSWRQPKITLTVEEAREQLEELLQVLREESDPQALRATFEELARTESDCSSAKRGGDLGFFGPKKMQPAFEAASFALEIGELSGIVETSSGVHVLLRVG